MFVRRFSPSREWQVLLGSKEIPVVVDQNFLMFVRRFSLSREWQVLLGSKEIPAFAGIEIYNLEMLWYFVCNHIEKLNLKSTIIRRVGLLNPIPAKAGISLFTLFILSFPRKREPHPYLLSEKFQFWKFGISLFTLFILSFPRKREPPYISQLNCHSSGSWN
jgi:hypothetical protein